MNYKEIQERLLGLTVHEHTPKEIQWAFQLATDLHRAIRALENIKGHRELTIIENTKGTYDFDIKSTDDYVWRTAAEALNKINGKE